VIQTSPPPAAKPTAKTDAQLRAAGVAAARQKALARKHAATRPPRAAEKTPPALAPSLEVSPNAGVSATSKRDRESSPLIGVLLLAAALLALVSMLLAALPLGALERLLAVEAHYRAEELVSFVDGHRVDIAVASTATLLVAVVVAIPTVTG
jgi:hypothetical protein